MKKLFIISGKAQNGKDATSDILISKLQGKSIKVALAGDLKTICKNYLGWDGKKSEEGRQLLQEIGTNKIRNEMHWDTFHAERVYQTVKIIQDYYDYIFVPDLRFKNELHYLSAMFPNDVISIRVNRLGFKSPLTESQLLHESECDLDNYMNYFDYFIESESGLDNLEKQIDKTFKGLLY